MSKLVLVPTPIGNIEDITIRSINTLKEANLILAEDTRVSGRLLKHYDISVQMQAFHQHNEHQILQSIIEKIKVLDLVCLITDAGTPGISDPGFLLVRECIRNDIEVECLPGATAFVPALVCSGLASEKFIFEGFLPHKKGRQQRLNALKDNKYTFVLYESPYRLHKTLVQLKETLGGDRETVVARELTKIYEEYKRGTLEELCMFYEDSKVKGEIVIIVKGSNNL